MEKLKQLRMEKGYTFKKMAELVGISKPFYWQLENNKRRMTYDLSVRIADVFGLRPDDLFYEEMKHHGDDIQKAALF